MGSLLCPVIANIYMERLEEVHVALDTAADQPSLWLCNVDDPFVIWPHGSDILVIFHSHLNSLRNKKEMEIIYHFWMCW